MNLLTKWKSFSLRRSGKPEAPPAKAKYVLSAEDIKMVAGDDFVATQLDLARAYIEIGKRKLARSILEHVIKTGNAGQQLEAKRLIHSL